VEVNFSGSEWVQEGGGLLISEGEEMELEMGEVEEVEEEFWNRCVPASQCIRLE
jgi:hypothetical protein